MNKQQIDRDLDKIMALIKPSEYVFLVCGLDENNNPHICDFGTQRLILTKLVGETLESLTYAIISYFEINKLQRNKPYALKLYVENGRLVIEYFESLNAMLPMKRAG